MTAPAAKPTINPNGLLAGKVAIVTGASRGIGEAIALRYAMEGAKVVATARTVDAADHPFPGTITDTVNRIRNAGGEAIAVRADIGQEADRISLVKAAQDIFGGVDILVNNAAVTWFIPVETFPEKRFKMMMEVQVWAPFHLSQMVLPHMRERKAGWILNVSSHAAIHPRKDVGGRGGTVYGMCKAALERFTTGLAAEVFNDNIAVNVISPGLVATPGTVHHNLLNDANKDRQTPIEVMAEACLRLCHGTADEVSGRIDYADQVVKEFALKAADLI